MMFKDPGLSAQLDELYARSEREEAEIDHYFRTRTGPWTGMEPRDHEFLADKLVALDRDKAEFCYLLCRAMGAARIVEVGTSFGVSTIHLAAAVRDNAGGVVIGAEYEPQKVRGARANLEAAGLSQFVDLREGDVLEAFRGLDGPIDFILFDIWGHVVRPALDLLLPHLRTGGVICTDNTAGDMRKNYAPFFEVIEDPASGFQTMTLPFKGGFEVSVKT